MNNIQSSETSPTDLEARISASRAKVADKYRGFQQNVEWYKPRSFHPQDFEFLDVAIAHADLAALLAEAGQLEEAESVRAKALHILRTHPSTLQNCVDYHRMPSLVAEVLAELGPIESQPVKDYWKNRLRFIRDVLGLSEEDIAVCVGVKSATVNRWQAARVRKGIYGLSKPGKRRRAKIQELYQKALERWKTMEDFVYQFQPRE